MENDDFLEPTDIGNFLQRYHEARAARSAPTTPVATKPTAPASPTSPSSPPARTPKGALSTWRNVFMPLGKPATSADRYDLAPGQTSKPGFSVSELHAKGTGKSLDVKNEDE
ncbi:hypothetical protein BWQ96_02332 [Gracilariopsis chorda]|uniref:Uncharacterized protein n=1 Tax=Gracilariopsis chorda TaxID=448386 RepID=A0A2V3J0K5_9FLOR|nr:hypothetical protein BWQ96_02332 [Gracilariopsis chorda]|eukprot:PXF47946.1 hypothetical protein BWQ96_02332 [Gracilariopsis chorda]